MLESKMLLIKPYKLFVKNFEILTTSGSVKWRGSMCRKLRIFKHGREFRSEKIQALQDLTFTQKGIIRSLRGQLWKIGEDVDDEQDDLTLVDYDVEDY
jgi:hypothetical protein